MRMLRGQRAISPVLATLLLVIITFAVGILFYAFTSGMVMNLTSNESTQQPFSLLIENVNINNTCITVYLRNSRSQDVFVERAYVNEAPHDLFNAVNNKVVIPKNSLAQVYILGSYSAGTLYEIKLALSSGSSLTSMKRY
jgi:flagellin-like protein